MSASSARFVQRLGLAFLAAGLLAGAAVYLTAGDDSEVDELARQREMDQVARLGGTASVQTVEFDQWLASLWHGRRLGLTLIVLGAVAGAACRHVGGLMAEAVDEDEPAAR